MIQYTSDNELPCAWSDFRPLDNSNPSFTIMTREEYDSGIRGDIEGWENEDWCNIVIDDYEVTKEIAERLIAYSLDTNDVEILL